MIDILERSVKRHPKTTFIAWHFANCSYDLTRLSELFDKYRENALRVLKSP